MIIDTLRFGIVEVDEKKTLFFSEGLPGLEQYKEFAVLSFDESRPIVWLQSITDRGVCLPVIDSFEAVPDYAFNLDDADVQDLEIGGPEDLQIISVMVIPENIEQMTVNLAAPIIINLRTCRAKQVILQGGEYNVRSPIFAEIMRLIREAEANAGIIKED